MYLGSVKFFKHLVVVAVAGIFVYAAVGLFAIVRVFSLSAELARQNETLQRLETQNQKLQQSVDFLLRKATDAPAVPAAPDETDPVSGDAPEDGEEGEDAAADGGLPAAGTSGEILPVTAGVAARDTSRGDEATARAPYYVSRYDTLYVEPPAKAAYVPDTVYLTFVSVPGDQTTALLDKLDACGVQAAFFVKPDRDGTDAAYLRQIVARGHTIGVYASSGDLRALYESVDAYLTDFAAASEDIEKATGVKPDIFRFPGGSVNAYNRAICQSLTAEMARRGYVYFDWDASGDDRDAGATAQTVAQKVVAGVQGHDRSIVLLHDGRDSQATVGALEEIVTTLQGKGYSFGRLTNAVQPVVFTAT